LLAAFDTTLAIYGAKPYGVIDADGLNATLLENPDLIVIDVRRADELEAGVIDIGAEATFIHIALEDLLANKDLWPADKEARIVIYCGSGHRSTMALTILGLNGYTDLSSLKGGFGGWVGAGFPVVEYAAP
jgi:hydroxyacylglutathione hydrolase